MNSTKELKMFEIYDATNYDLCRKISTTVGGGLKGLFGLVSLKLAGKMIQFDYNWMALTSHLWDGWITWESCELPTFDGKKTTTRYSFSNNHGRGTWPNIAKKNSSSVVRILN